MTRFCLLSMFILSTLAGLANLANGGEGCCQHCGCNVRKVCRLVCEDKKVPVINYEVKCDDICLHGKSHKCGCEWIPSCGKVKTVKKLVKVETSKIVPTHKCVVDYICCECGHKITQNAPAGSTPGPSPAQVASESSQLAPIVAKPAKPAKEEMASQPESGETSVAQEEPAAEEALLAPLVSKSEFEASRLPPIVSRPIPKKTK